MNDRKSSRNFERRRKRRRKIRRTRNRRRVGRSRSFVRKQLFLISIFFFFRRIGTTVAKKFSDGDNLVYCYCDERSLCAYSTRTVVPRKNGGKEDDMRIFSYILFGAFFLCRHHQLLVFQKREEKTMERKKRK